MREDEFGLRDAAKAADRAKAAEELRPAFEKRLGELGYHPLAIAHAFSLLRGPGTVAEALEALKHRPTPTVLPPPKQIVPDRRSPHDASIDAEALWQELRRQVQQHRRFAGPASIGLTGSIDGEKRIIFHFLDRDQDTEIHAVVRPHDYAGLSPRAAAKQIISDLFQT